MLVTRSIEKYENKKFITLFNSFEPTNPSPPQKKSVSIVEYQLIWGFFFHLLNLIKFLYFLIFIHLLVCIVIINFPSFNAKS